MSRSIYSRLALTNLKNNKKTYLPYILTAILTVMMYYMIDALSRNNGIGEGNLQLVLTYAVGVVIIFAVIFLFYTNSFLIKRRKKEIGVYNILGMGKRHIARMLFVETLIISIVSIAAGLVFGVLFSRFMWLVLLKILRYDVRMSFDISGVSIFRSLVLFGIIFGMTLIYNLLQIRLANPVELLRGGRQGEKEPKTKWLLTILGIAALGTGYYIAVVTESPLQAIGSFFIAVVCVILGTYALFIAGSIALLKILRKRKGFYYKAKHFTAVSGMIYRMKQNAVGLANICILSTMVLVMTSTTVSLYMGMEDVLETRFPKEFEVRLEQNQEDVEKEQRIHEIIEEETRKAGVSVKDMESYHYGVTAARIKENIFKTSGTNDAYTGGEDVCEFYMIPQEDYNRLENENVSLKENEVIIYNPEKDAEKFSQDTIVINEDTYHIVKELDIMKIEKKNRSNVIGGYYVIFSERSQIETILQNVYNRLIEQNPDYKGGELKVCYKINFNLSKNKEKGNEVVESIQSRLDKEVPEALSESREMNREGFYILYGGLLFIGIYLGVMFLMAMVLIIYYKQISEGYEDKERYQIMQKVGMNRREVRHSIRSQILIVFFLPLVTAVIHIAVAFKVITKLLALLNLVNIPLFFTCTVVTVAVFAVFYGIIFTMTAREYYEIVK